MLNNSVSPKNKRVQDPQMGIDAKGILLPPIVSEIPSDYYATSSSVKGGS